MRSYKRKGCAENKIKFGIETNIMRSEGRARPFLATQEAFIISGRKVLWGFLSLSTLGEFFFLIANML